MTRNNKRHLSSLDELTSTPPTSLPESHVIARIEKAQGTNIFLCTLPSQTMSEDKGKSQETVLAELSSIFRGATWLRRGGYVVINTATFEGRENKLSGEIVNVVRNEAAWRKMTYWPTEFKKSQFEEDESEDDSVVGKMPPNSDDED